MPEIFQLQFAVANLFWWGVLIVELVALVDAALRPAQAFHAAGKMTKQGWLMILGLALLVQLVLAGAGLLQLMGLVAALVYLIDARPALRAVTRRR